ncbi:MAG: hypothetical protein AAB774_00400 [Patescibacteria group bacterium]
MLFRKKPKSLLVKTVRVFDRIMVVDDLLRSSICEDREFAGQAIFFTIWEKEDHLDWLLPLERADDNQIVIEALSGTVPVIQYTAQEFRQIKDHCENVLIPGLIKVGEKLDVIGADANLNDALRLMFESDSH